ncbi:MAG: alpha/beta hydrolase [Microbacteriaceae bacterium]|nr:alpha/beta hydrolase [Microbacteriaceae bacterium]
MSEPSPFATLLDHIPVEKHEITVLGSRTSYWVYGPADAPTTIVIAHGYRGEHHGLEPVIAQLPGIRWIGPDMPGFGESTPMTEAPHSITGYASWLTAFTAELGLSESSIMLGHSFGSIISSQAIASGARPKALVLINPIAISGLEGPNKTATKLTVWFYRTAGRLPAPVGNWMLKHWLVTHFVNVNLVKTHDQALRRWIYAEHHMYFNRFASRDVVVEAFEASVSANVSDFAAQLTLPTLFVAAELDDITPIQAVIDLAESMPATEIVVLKDVGHLVHYEVPALAAEAISRFVEKLESPAT